MSKTDQRGPSKIQTIATAPYLMRLGGRFAVFLGEVVHLVLLTLQFSRKGETKTSAQSWVRN